MKLVFAANILCKFVVATGNVDGHKGSIHTLSAKTNGQAFMDINVIMNFARNKNLLYRAFKDKRSIAVTDAQYFSNSINLGIGVAAFLDLAVSFPLYYDNVTFDDKTNYKGFGSGDLTLSLKAVYPPTTKKSFFYQGFYLGGTIPIGSTEKGLLPKHLFFVNDENDTLQPNFFTADAVTLKSMLMWTLDFGNIAENFQFSIDINTGVALALELDKDHHMIFGGALRYAPHNVIDIFFDINSKIRFRNFKNLVVGSDPFTVSPGLRFNIPKGTYIQIAGDFGIKGTSAKEKWKASNSKDVKSTSLIYETASTPSAVLHVSLGWNGALTPLDKDEDGIKDNDDRCPKIPEDKDNFEDEDGCPEDDNDKDGVKDQEDKCPNKPEDPDGYEDEDGCPEDDNDKDGIADIQDKCPQIAEDFDGIDDSDGCPDNDNDKDGIADSTDKCPNEPEDRDQFEDNDGCPDLDNDKDGIPDTKDKCPDKAELFNGVEDQDGCPELVEKKKEVKMPRHQVLEGVRFRSGSSRLTPNSFASLDPLAELLEKNQDITIEIRGHTDITGKYSTNMRISQRRANSVKNYLTSRGIASYRIRAVGFGPDNPIAENSTMEGRARNRRIEVIRTNQ